MQDLTHHNCYLAALSEGHSHLEQISDEVMRLSSRMHHLRAATESLENFMNSAGDSDRRPEPGMASCSSHQSVESASRLSSDADPDRIPSAFVKGVGSAGEEINRRIHYALGLASA